MGLRLGSGSVLRALEDDHVTEIGLDRLDGTGEDTTEESDSPVRVGDFIRDVGPLEVATVVDGIEADATSPGEGVRDLGFANVRVDDERSLVRSGFIRCLRGSDPSRHIVRHDAGKSGTCEREARSEVIDQVVIPTERLLNTKGSDKIADLAIVVADIVAETSLRKELVRRFRGTHQTENRATVLATVGIRTTTLADHVVVDLVKDRVGDVCRRNGKRGRSPSTEVKGSGDRVTFKPVLDRSASGNRANVAVANPSELVTISVFPRIPDSFGHGVHDGTKLFLAVNGESEILQRDAGGFDNRTVNGVVLQLLGEPNIRPFVQRSGAATTLDIFRSVLERLVEIRSEEVIGTGIKGSERRPSNPSRVASRISGRDSPIIDQRGKLITHPVREGRLLHQIEPRGSVERPIVNVLVDPVCLFGKDRVDGRNASS